MEEGSLLITVNNEDPQPIEVQLHSGLFRKEDAWKWGACLSTFFSFKYSVQFNRFFQVQILNLHDETNQMEQGGDGDDAMSLFLLYRAGRVRGRGRRWLW